jgi:hypothetical protein
MAEEQSNPEKKGLSTNMIIIGAVVVAFALGGFYYYKQTQTKKVSVSIGGKEISATFQK